MESELGISELCEVVEQCPAGGGEVDSGVRVEVGGEEKVALGDNQFFKKMNNFFE